jgi:hypothetical protein
MCPTIYGRVQTRWAILIVPAIIAAIISGITGNPSWIVVIGVYFLIGVALDIGFYPFIIRWQPPWLTFTLAVGEFVLTYIAALVLHRHVNGHIVGIHFAHFWLPIIEFWVAWWIAIWTKVVVLPLLSLSWIENAGEFRSTGWSVPPEYVPLPVEVFTPVQAGAGPPPLARKFSAAVIEIPEELRRAPSPSGVHRIPEELRSAPSGSDGQGTPTGPPPA